jgi:hypothetical protein
MDIVGGIGQPTNQEREIIVEGVEGAGAPCGKTKDSRSAES